jgi:hypothetical protein
MERNVSPSAIRIKIAPPVDHSIARYWFANHCHLESENGTEFRFSSGLTRLRLDSRSTKSIEAGTEKPQEPRAVSGNGLILVQRKIGVPRPQGKHAAWEPLPQIYVVSGRIFPLKQNSI